MGDENLVTITNNENPPINLEITAYRNEVNVELVESVESVLAAHNACEDAHNNRFSDLESRVDIKLQANTAEIKTELDAKADIEATNALLTNKLDKADTTVTKLGNSFNGANQLVQINSGGKLPALDGSLLTELPAANRALSNITAGAGTNMNAVGIRTIIDTYRNGTSWYRVWSDGWIEQGGMCTGGQAMTLTFLKPFTNTNYYISASILMSSQSLNMFSWWTYARFTTYCQYTSVMRNPNNAAGYTGEQNSWYACGY